jgi:Flp pilus assembly protein TadG
MAQQQGQALVEFAVVLPVLILIILGILYFGRYENYSSQETQLAGEAARYASVDGQPSCKGAGCLQAYILSQASPELQSGSSDVTKAAVYIYYPTGSSDAVGNPVRACVVTTVQFPFLPGGAASKMVETSTMRIETADGSNNFWVADTLPLPAAGSACPTS